MQPGWIRHSAAQPSIAQHTHNHVCILMLTSGLGLPQLCDAVASSCMPGLLIVPDTAFCKLARMCTPPAPSICLQLHRPPVLPGRQTTAHTVAQALT